MLHFSVGFAAALPSGANPTPIPFALLNGVTISVKPTYKFWTGNMQHPEAAGLSAISTTAKIDTVSVFAGAVALIHGVTPTTGSVIPYVNEAHTAVANTFTATNTTGFVDYGCMNLTDGILMTRVASAPAAGQYSVNASGVYTFNATDGTKNYSITYTATSASVGKTTSVVQAVGGLISGVQLVGFAPSNNGKPNGWKLWNALPDDLSLTYKSDDFVTKSVSFTAIKDPTTGNVSTYWNGE